MCAGGNSPWNVIDQKRPQESHSTSVLECLNILESDSKIISNLGFWYHFICLGLKSSMARPETPPPPPPPASPQSVAHHKSMPTFALPLA